MSNSNAGAKLLKSIGQLMSALTFIRIVISDAGSIHLGACIVCAALMALGVIVYFTETFVDDAFLSLSLSAWVLSQFYLHPEKVSQADLLPFAPLILAVLAQFQKGIPAGMELMLGLVFFGLPGLFVSWTRTDLDDAMLLMIGMGWNVCVLTECIAHLVQGDSAQRTVMTKAKKD